MAVHVPLPFAAMHPAGIMQMIWQIVIGIFQK